MRALERSIVLLVIAIVILLSYRSCSDTVLSYFGYDHKLEAEIVTSTFFPIDNTKWYDYDVSGSVDEIRIVGHAMIPGEEFVEEAKYRYQIHYQLLSEDQSVLHEQVYNLISKAAPFYVTDAGERRYSRFYAESNKLPIMDQAFYLKLSSYGKVHTLRLRAGIDPEADYDVGTRVYRLEPSVKDDWFKRWQRSLPEEQLTKLKNHPYPAPNVSKYEIHSIMKKEYQPIGPVGVENKDYRSDTVYKIEIPDDAIVGYGGSLRAANNYADAHHYVTIPLAEYTSVHLRFAELMPDAPANTIRMRWQSQDTPARKSWQVVGPEWRGSLGAGLLEISASYPTNVATISPEGIESIARGYLRTYAVSSGTPVNYRINPLSGGRKQALRIDLRIADPGRAGGVQVVLFDAAGTIIQRRSLALRFLHNRYWQSTKDPGAELISDKQSIYFQLPSSARRASIISDTPVYVSAYTRPEWLRHETSVPSLLADDTNGERSLPIWFLLYPESEEELYAKSQVKLLAWYKPWRDQDEFLTAEDYQVNVFEPSNSGVFKTQLMAYDPPKRSVRRDALSSRYCRISTGIYPISVFSGFQQDLVAAKLAYSGTQARDRISVTINDNQNKIYPTAKSGIISLPKLIPGRHSVGIHAGLENLWINKQEKNCPYIVRKVNPVLGKTEFNIESADYDRPLTLALYFPNNDAKFVSYQLHIKRKHRSAESYTLRSRRLNIDTKTLERAWLMDGSGKQVLGPLKLSFSLGKDIATKAISLSVTADSDKAFATLTQTIESGQLPVKDISPDMLEKSP